MKVGKKWKGRITERKKKGKRGRRNHRDGEKWFEIDTLMRK